MEVRLLKVLCILEASLFLSCARVVVLGDCRSGDERFRTWDGTAERGKGCNVSGPWCVFFSAIVGYYLLRW